MKAMVLERFGGTMTWREAPDPKLGPREVLVGVKANGLCATDLKIVDGLVPTVTLPHILGHEAAGEVVEVGEEVDGLEPGAHVAVFPALGCGACDSCRTDSENLCQRAPRTGFELDGGFTQYIRVRDRNAIRIDRAVPLEEAAILPDAVATVYHALVRRARVQVGETVVIIGIGGLGIHAVQMACITGARVIAADIAPEKLQAAEKFGAEVINSDKEELPARVKALTGGLGADVVAECVGGHAVSNVLKEGIACLKPGGRLVVVGYMYQQPLSVDTAELIYGQWSILGTRASSLQDLVAVVRLVESGRLKPVVSKRFPLERANEALEVLRESPPLGRIVLTS
jgi:propanol-preferring alcohol dehydrogenase